MRILVTGGAGYIGSVLTGELLTRGHEVTVIDNLMYKQLSLFQYCSNPNFTFVRGDVRDEALMKRLVEPADVIIPLAAIVGAGASERDPLLTTSVNLDAIKLLNRIRRSDQKVVFPCTNSGYGTQSGEMYCTEETPLEPISLYGKTKVEAERILLDSGNVVTLRFATVFGISPRMRLDLLVNDFVYKAVTEGYLVLYEEHFKRNYIHIRDAARAFIHAIEHFDAMKGEAYNAGLDEANLSKRELAEKVKQYVPNFYLHSAAVGEDPDKRNYVVSNDKIREQGFEAQVTLDEGITELLKGYRLMSSTNFYNS
ncbi:MAG: NAD(P)-dependent oxidoreductase [Dehalococcoidia bacterium]